MSNAIQHNGLNFSSFLSAVPINNQFRFTKLDTTVSGNAK